MNSPEVLTRWLAAIKSHDVTALTALMAPHFVFIDALANRLEGAESMESAWRGYFTMCPDYWIRADHVMADGDTVLAAGEAGGTIDGEAWRTPAAWKALIREGAVVEWHVYADNKPVYEILKKRP
jgi:ketosteroid isomerase-like protein